MPFYDFKCKCGEVGEKYFPSIGAADRAREAGSFHPIHCDKAMSRVYDPRGAAHIDYQNKGVYPMMVEDLGVNPVQIESHQHLQKELKRQGLFEADKPKHDGHYKLKELNRRFF